MTRSIFLVLLLKHAAAANTRSFHREASGTCEAERAAVRRQMHGGAAGAAYGATAPKLQGCSPLPVKRLRRDEPKKHHATEATPMERSRLADVRAARRWRGLTARRMPSFWAGRCRSAKDCGGHCSRGPRDARLQALLRTCTRKSAPRGRRRRPGPWTLARLLPVCPMTL